MSLPSPPTVRRATDRCHGNDGGRALNDLVEVMIKVRQGRIAEAREQFKQAMASLDRAPDVRLTSTVILNDWLEFQVLRRQIKGPLQDAVFPVDRFAGRRSKQFAR
jgi:hypothetical protein